MGFFLALVANLGAKTLGPVVDLFAPALVSSIARGMELPPAPSGQGASGPGE